MAYFPDLSTKCSFESGPEVRAIGWLSAEHAFTQGTVSPEFFTRLAEHVTTAWQPVVTFGMHGCEFCSLAVAGAPRFPRFARLSCANVWIPAPGRVYVAPGMILHYVADHGYAPPAEFIAAVFACPPQGSREYFTLLHSLPVWWAQVMTDWSLEEAFKDAQGG
jgi:hypothetical protein